MSGHTAQPSYQQSEIEADIKPIYSKGVDIQLDQVNHTDGTSVKIVEHQQLKSELDELSTFKLLKLFRNAVLICGLAGFSAATDGYQLKMNSNVVANTGFIRQFAPDGKKLDPTHVSAWGGLFSAGMVVGQFTIQWFADRFGRKITNLICLFVLGISVTVEVVSVNWWMFAIGKISSGAGIGAIQTVLTTYINEHAPAPIRGSLVVAYSLWFSLGQLLASVTLKVRSTTDPLDWKTPLYTQFGMVGIAIVIFVFLPETPWWLVSRGKIAQATRVLHKINGTIPGYDADREVGIIAATIEQQRIDSAAAGNEGYLAIFKGLDGKRFLIGSWPKQFVGLAIFNSYSAYFFQLAGNPDTYSVTIILGSVNIVAYVFDVLFIDRLGRRFMTLLGFSGVCFGMTLMAIVGCLDYTDPALGKLLVFAGVFASFCNSFQSSTGYAYLTEVPVQRLKARAVGWGLAYCNLYAIIFNFTVPLMLNVWAVKATFFFVALGIPGTIVAYFIMPETSKRSPAEIQEMFVERVPLRKWKGHKTAVQRNLELRLGREEI